MLTAHCVNDRLTSVSELAALLVFIIKNASLIYDSCKTILAYHFASGHLDLTLMLNVTCIKLHYGYVC